MLLWTTCDLESWAHTRAPELPWRSLSGVHIAGAVTRLWHFAARVPPTLCVPPALHQPVSSLQDPGPNPNAITAFSAAGARTPTLCYGSPEVGVDTLRVAMGEGAQGQRVAQRACCAVQNHQGPE